MRKILFLSFCLLICFCLFGCKKGEKVEEKKTQMLRQPAVAGAFYPGTKEELETKIESFFKNVPELEEKEEKLRILIVPHAGYDYSGQVAAFGFKEIQGEDYQRVILLGGSHQAFFEDAVIDENDLWETPLGKVAIDKALAQKIIDDRLGVSFSSSAHAQEHSLEVEIPFLQKTLKSFKFVPILLGEASADFLENLAKTLVKYVDQKTLVVISTDLSHYPSYDVANQVDDKTIKGILTGDDKAFAATISAQMEEGYPNLATCVCGEKAVRAGTILAQKLGITEIRLLKYANSGDASGDTTRVVGYASIGFYEGIPNTKYQIPNTQSKNQEDLLDEKAQEEALEIARRTLESYLKDEKVPAVEIENEVLNQKLGAFVTLRKEGQLRGCIGRFEPDEPLWKIIQEMAVSAATKDIRFPPVDYSELTDIRVEISVLSPRRKIDNWQEIELGKHGVYLEKGRQGGVFLPQVATENNWDLETFMGTLCAQKAGLPQNCWKQKDVDLYVFTAQVFEEHGS